MRKRRRRAAEFTDAMNAVKQTVNAAAIAIGSGVAPILTELARGFQALPKPIQQVTFAAGVFFAAMKIGLVSLRTALVSTGIGALIIAAGALAVKLGLIGAAAQDATPTMKDLTTAINDQIVAAEARGEQLSVETARTNLAVATIKILVGAEAQQLRATGELSAAQAELSRISAENAQTTGVWAAAWADALVESEMVKASISLLQGEIGDLGTVSDDMRAKLDLLDDEFAAAGFTIEQVLDATRDLGLSEEALIKMFDAVVRATQEARDAANDNAGAIRNEASAFAELTSQGLAAALALDIFNASQDRTGLALISLQGQIGGALDKLRGLISQEAGVGEITAQLIGALGGGGGASGGGGGGGGGGGTPDNPNTATLIDFETPLRLWRDRLRAEQDIVDVIEDKRIAAEQAVADASNDTAEALRAVTEAALAEARRNGSINRTILEAQTAAGIRTTVVDLINNAASGGIRGLSLSRGQEEANRELLEQLGAEGKIGFRRLSDGTLVVDQASGGNVQAHGSLNVTVEIDGEAIATAVDNVEEEEAFANGVAA